jgi:ABC-type transport system involved in multi-copper enzyme maturation permease subunit
MIKLDWLGMKCFHSQIIIMPVMAILCGFLYTAAIIPFMALFAISALSYSFAIEEKGQLEQLYLTLPITRHAVVKARFIFAFCICALFLALGIFATLIMSPLLYGKSVLLTNIFVADFNSMVLLVCGCLLYHAIMTLSMMPLLFKMGYIKGKSFGIYIPIVVTIILFYCSVFIFGRNDHAWLLSALDWLFSNIQFTAVAMIFVSAIIYVIAYVLSVRNFSRREF